MKNTWDLLVVGSGPGSAEAVRQAAGLGLETGWVLSPHSLLLDPGPGISIVRAEGFQFEGPGRLRLDRGTLLEAKGIILAMDSAPVRIPGVEPDGARILQGSGDPHGGLRSGTVLVAGGGTEGMLLASRLADEGRPPVLVERRARVLEELDNDAVAFLAHELVDRGIDLRFGVRLAGAVVQNGKIRCRLLNGEQEEMLEVDRVVTTVGRRPQTRNLGLESVEVIRDRRGRIQTDSRMESATPGLFAIGAMVPTPNDTPLAGQEAVVAVRASAGLEVEPIRYGQAVLSLGTQPELAWWGLTEKEAEDRGHFLAVDRRTGSRGGGTMTKVVADADTGRILGLHLVGPDAKAVLTGVRTTLEDGSGKMDWSRIWDGPAGGNKT